MNPKNIQERKKEDISLFPSLANGDQYFQSRKGFWVIEIQPHETNHNDRYLHVLITSYV
jgi:hypothetical protein